MDRECSTHNIETANADGAYRLYKKLSRSTFVKCQALGNKQPRSNIAAEVISDSFGLQLVVPNQTRWNSMYSTHQLNALTDS